MEKSIKWKLSCVIRFLALIVIYFWTCVLIYILGCCLVNACNFIDSEWRLIWFLCFWFVGVGMLFHFCLFLCFVLFCLFWLFRIFFLSFRGWRLRSYLIFEALCQRNFWIINFRWMIANQWSFCLIFFSISF